MVANSTFATIRAALNSGSNNSQHRSRIIGRPAHGECAQKPRIEVTPPPGRLRDEAIAMTGITQRTLPTGAMVLMRTLAVPAPAHHRRRPDRPAHIEPLFAVHNRVGDVDAPPARVRRLPRFDGPNGRTGSFGSSDPTKEGPPFKTDDSTAHPGDAGAGLFNCPNAPAGSPPPPPARRAEARPPRPPSVRADLPRRKPRPTGRTHR